MSHLNALNSVIPDTIIDNSGWDMLYREAGKHIDATAVLGGTGAQTVNVFEFTGTIQILNQWAIITDATTLTNCTGVYADIYDGTTAVDLTLNGAVLSGAPVGTFFTKNQTAAQTYTTILADQCRVTETVDDKRAGRPFTITGKNGVTNYIRFHYTTTDNPINFTIFVHFEYYLFNGATLSLA